MFSLWQALIEVPGQKAHTRIQTPSHVHANSHEQIIVSFQDNDDCVIGTCYYCQLNHKVACIKTCPYDDG
jgi:hypothetical protein